MRAGFFGTLRLPDGATLRRARVGAALRGVVVFFAVVFGVFAVAVVFRVRVVFGDFVVFGAFETFGAVFFVAADFALDDERFEAVAFGADDLLLSLGTIKTSLLLLMIITHFSALFNSCFFERLC